MRQVLLAGALALLSGCTTTVPVAVIGEDGRILTGTNTATLFEGSFRVSDGRLTCAGSYDPLQQSQTISMPVLCNDGRKGIVRSTRDTATSGSGTVRLDDGWKADFVFGKSAENFQ
jgi:hypothetical protein